MPRSAPAHPRPQPPTRTPAGCAGAGGGAAHRVLRAVLRVGLAAGLVSLTACAELPEPLEPSEVEALGALLRGAEERPCFHPERGDLDTSCLTREELAALLADSDRDGRNNLEEVRGGGDPFNAADGPDIDGDGLANGDDDDVDGDGVPNRQDFDVDGDGIFNDHDPDIDADGLLNDDDPDSDGDGLSDRFDLDDDGDDEPDDEDEDDEDDQPREKLEDLIDRLKDGELTDADKNAIANEISERLGNFEKQAAVQAALIEVVGQALADDREQPPTTAPPGVAAVDAVYRQLTDALEYVRGQQDDPKAPLNREQLQLVAEDFLPRASGVARLGRTFKSLSIDQLSTSVADLRAAAGPERFPEIAQELQAHVDPDARGTGAGERRELELLTRGVSRLARAFPDALGGDLLNVLDRVRDLAGDDQDLEAAEVDRLVDRMEEIAADNPTATIFDVIDTVEDEEA